MSLEYGILHNAKTAGTALFEVIRQGKERGALSNVRVFGHHMTLPRFIDQYPDAKAIFFIRDPISRFISSFYSRLRQGQPRYFFPWSSKEKIAFSQFNSPNQLAEALSSINLFKRRQAYLAMNSIRHIRQRYTEFLGSLEFLTQVADQIAHVGHQPDFDADLEHLKTLFKLDEDIKAPNDDISAHRNPKDIDRALSMLAIENLEKWYREDYDIYRWCLAYRSAKGLVPSSNG